LKSKKNFQIRLNNWEEEKHTRVELEKRTIRLAV
jgi:hypothetical protein